MGGDGGGGGAGEEEAWVEFRIRIALCFGRILTLKKKTETVRGNILSYPNRIKDVPPENMPDRRTLLGPYFAICQICIHELF